MKTIALVTATRAEYGLLYPVILQLREKEDSSFKVEVIVTGTHLVQEYGETVNEIRKDGIRIDYELEIPVASDSPCDISNNQAATLTKFTELFFVKKYCGVVLLGDRYELLSIAIAAANTHTPIFHLCGGDTTEGAMDEWIRHSITKMSYLHFVTNEESRKRVIQLGEAPERVFDFGSTSIDNILQKANMTKEEALASVGLQNCEYILCTYHPTTMEISSVEAVMEDFLEAIKDFPEIQFVVTKSNSDLGGAMINRILDDASQKISNLHVYSSLGVQRYLSLMKYAKCVLGNSSSGIVETPTFHIPTVNIGNRQKGRLQAESIINCGCKHEEIVEAIRVAMSAEMQKKCQGVISPYGDGMAAHRIADTIYNVVLSDSIDLQKSFYLME